MLRLTRGIGALAALLLLLFGVPTALVVLCGNPFPASLSWSSVRVALFTPDDGSILVGVITVVAWVAWLVFALSVLSELVALVSHRRIRVRLPGMGAPQRMAAGLLISVIAMLSMPQIAQEPPVGPSVVAPTAESVPVAPVLGPVVPESPASSAPVSLAGPSGRVAVDHVTHMVKTGDDLWSLAEHYYGEGRSWRKIAQANPQLLSGGPDRLQPGWRLHIPDVDAPAAQDGARSVAVRRGDTLSSIAEHELGSAERWDEIYRRNRAQLADPDELAIGVRLRLPGEPGSTTKASSDGARRPEQVPADEDHREPVEPVRPAPQAAPTAAPTITTAPPTQAAPSPSTSQEGEAEVGRVDHVALPLAGVGGLLAAGLIAGVGVRRRIQLQIRPVGRRIAQPTSTAQAVEIALGRRQRPLSLRTLDRASRAIAAHSRRTDTPLPPLLYALVGNEKIELVFARPCPDAPVGFSVRGCSWVLNQTDAPYLSSVPGLNEAPRPWPALVTLGRDEQDRLVVADLEGMGLLQVEAGEPGAADGVLAAMVVELSFSPWADEMFLTLVGSDAKLPQALGKHNVTRTDDLDALLTRMEHRAAAQRAQRPHAVLGQHRIDPDLADPWAPEIVLVNRPLTAEQRSRLQAVVTVDPRVTMAAVVVDAAESAPWSLRMGGLGASPAVLEPVQLTLSPQYLDPPTANAVIDLVRTTGSELTTPAHWWAEVADPPDPPPDNVTFLGKRFGGWGDEEIGQGEGARMQKVAAAVSGDGRRPTLLLLGPVELSDAAGNPPPRAGKQCLEYCAWLLEHPGTTAQAMASALIVAEGTRRSNMSRLRGWLGSDPAGEAYLPDAYTGRIVLHPSVSSDWQHLQILITGGANRASTDGLRVALDLVRGAPLADAAPGQWHWAEELRTDMISCLRDIGVELATRALEQGDIDLARWAAARALVAAPGDELLMAARIRTEHLAGNAVETERLTLQLAAQARALGLDLDAETVILLQQVMEGRVRARMA